VCVCAPDESHSYLMNYPAKHFCAEDMLRHKETLMPLVACIIAFLPQPSCRELIALHDAGALELVAIGHDSVFDADLAHGGVNVRLHAATTQHYGTFVDCSGQPHLDIDQFPFRSLVDSGVLTQAYLKFRSRDAALAARADAAKTVIEKADGAFYLRVPGVAINDDFQPLDADGKACERVFILAVPFIGGECVLRCAVYTDACLT
jgi:hypothetical protein